DRDENEADQIDQEGRPELEQRGRLSALRRFQIEHHDGDDDGDDAVGESLEAGLREPSLRFGHRRLPVARQRVDWRPPKRRAAPWRNGSSIVAPTLARPGL